MIEKVEIKNGFGFKKVDRKDKRNLENVYSKNVRLLIEKWISCFISCDEKS
ncbi:hypothetical protein D037_2771 [Vibrio parahaemolyticus IDH02640]|nr:hypothetical protein D037_2771 [Vibrio parahaemolyticus IDH02640]